MYQDVSHDINVLLRQMCQSGEQTFRVVYDHYKAPFYFTAFKITHSGPIAEEIIQEVFVTIWMKRDLIAKSEKPEGYVITILHNCIYSRYRQLAKERKLNLKMQQTGDQSENSIEDLLIEKENRTILENVITQLPPRQKLIYRLAKQEDMSREEIASKLNVSPNTVRNHLALAVEYLRTHLKRVF